MKSNIDLHIHSDYSDGDYSVDEIINILRNVGIKIFSITDHDNIKSYEYLKNKKLKDIEYISGVELSTYHKRQCFHILGYNYHGNIKALTNLLNKISDRRITRAKEMIKKIEKNNNLKFNKHEVKEVLSHPSVGKKHVAKMMMKNNIGESYSEILKNYMTGLHLPTSYRVSVSDACDAIKKSNGIPVLAHPKEYELRYGIKIEDILEELISDGIMGIEVYNSIHTLDDSVRYLRLAKKYNLLITGGSDYHGASKSKVLLGNIINNIDDIKAYEHLTIVDEINRS